MDYHETFEKADININTVGDNVIIPAPGDGKYIAIDHINFIPAAALTLQLKDGVTNYGGAYPVTTLNGFVVENSCMNEHGIITLSNNSAFTMNLSAAIQVSGFVRYRIVNK